MDRLYRTVCKDITQNKNRFHSPFRDIRLCAGFPWDWRLRGKPCTPLKITFLVIKTSRMTLQPPLRSYQTAMALWSLKDIPKSRFWLTFCRIQGPVFYGLDKVRTFVYWYLQIPPRLTTSDASCIMHQP